MKNIKLKIILPASILIIVAVVACSKSFLDKPPLGTLSPDLMANESGVQGLLIGAYAMVDGEGAAGDGFASGASNWIFGGVTSDDASDVADAAPIEDWTVTATNGSLPQKWTMSYAAIQRSNDVLRVMALATDISEEKQAQIAGQARFLRAFYHFELKKIFGNIIYADETVNPDNIDVSNQVDAWP